MITTRIVSVVIALGLTSLPGCSSTPTEKKPITFSTLPTREEQASFTADFAKVHAAALKVVRQDFGYTLTNEKMDATTGRSRLDGTLPGGGSIRLETERSRDFASTSVKVLVVPAGATAASVDAERDVLQRIADIVSPGGK